MEWCCTKEVTRPDRSAELGPWRTRSGGVAAVTSSRCWSCDPASSSLGSVAHALQPTLDEFEPPHPIVFRRPGSRLRSQAPLSCELNRVPVATLFRHSIRNRRQQGKEASRSRRSAAREQVEFTRSRSVKAKVVGSSPTAGADKTAQLTAPEADQAEGAVGGQLVSTAS
jgi:hypothetical protein